MESVTHDGQTTREVYIADSVWPSVALKKLVEDEITVTEEDLKNGFEAAYGPIDECYCFVNTQSTLVDCAAFDAL